MRKGKSYDKYLVDDLRHKYAVENNLIMFRKLYSDNMAEIPNINAGNKWDKLNKKTKACLERSPIYKNKISIVLKLLYGKHGNLLDIGFGSGFIERKLLKSNLNMFGIDISQESALSLGKDVKGVFEKGTVLNIPFKSNYFDYILILDVLEHISAKNTPKALREIYRVLKKGGTIIVSVPLNEGLKDLVKTCHNPNMHVREYTPEILKLELRLFNFLIEKEYQLYAFKNYYLLKKMLTEIIFKKFKKPNLYILVAKKK